MRVVICGAGAIGACTAYFLSRRGVEVVVVERHAVAGAASGKAGGFLALDWCGGSELDALARRSFDLHARLPAETGGEWGYRPVAAYAGFVAPRPQARGGRRRELEWLANEVTISAQLGSPQTTAIVHPRAFTAGIMLAAERLGAKLRRGRITGVVKEGVCGGAGAAIRGVEVDGEALGADAVVVALGPWCMLAAQWLRLPAVFGRKSPSLVYDTGTAVPAQALFLECEESDGEVVSVEVFSRADGSTHVTAFTDESPMPADPAAVAPDSSLVERLRRICERLAPVFVESRIIARQACFRPVMRDGLPLIGKIADAEGGYVATGHNVWGILNAPATGEAMAELIVEGAACHVDLGPFGPARLQRPGRD